MISKCNPLTHTMHHASLIMDTISLIIPLIQCSWIVMGTGETSRKRTSCYVFAIQGRVPSTVNLPILVEAWGSTFDKNDSDAPARENCMTLSLNKCLKNDTCRFENYFNSAMSNLTCLASMDIVLE